MCVIVVTFLVAVTKLYSAKLILGRIVLTHRSRVWSIMMGKAWWQEMRHWLCVFIVRELKEMSAGPQLAFFFISSLGPQPME